MPKYFLFVAKIKEGRKVFFRRVQGEGVEGEELDYRKEAW